MRLIVTRTGGFAGLRSEWDIDIEEQPDSTEWEILIDTLPWDDAAALPPEPDRFIYQIRCAPREVTLAERQVTGPWRELVDRVRQAGEPSSRRRSDGADPTR
ncbi:protealysin inhibitor emfourin [Agromyces atrinae]|uniref:Uncharacterized protein n=1 Tax=Agromyces atrinae TaxID=592376 RepID=A0A4Q2M855_9MICO|nr:protealysin inhibitor emfourin [Agromyces atrinae]NYD65810.1 hypothetical protein [Agromyces atrinae]RXZ86161.1 hypothetical protein ESP50_10315 [Agromyces atrinae]